MTYTRREFGKLALAGLPAAAVIGHTESIFGAFAQAKPNSYQRRADLAQSPTAIAACRSCRSHGDILDSGIGAIELMGGPGPAMPGSRPLEEAGAAAGLPDQVHQAVQRRKAAAGAAVARSTRPICLQARSWAAGTARAA